MLLILVANENKSTFMPKANKTAKTKKAKIPVV